RVFIKGYITHSANSGAEGLRLLGEHPIDIVLLDIMMPQISGLEVLKIIRESTEYADLPVLLISGLAETDDITKGLRLGANDYITKPFDIDIIRARVKTQGEVKRLNDERKLLITSLKAANHMKDHLMRIASHDLRNPLNNLQILNQLLRSFAADNPEMNGYLDLARDSINLMKEFIQQFFESEVLRDNAMDVKKESVSLEVLLDRVTKQHILIAEKKNIWLETRAVSGHVLADSARLLQVLSNLVSNAIKYSPQGSTIQVRSVESEGIMRVEVVDQGAGIPADERNHLFQPFAKLSTRPTDGESSMGLGLWIVKQLMTLQQGDVGVECPTEGGSVFWITLPAIQR
ncbi:MAG: response regulator, partial [Chitinophagaceae bacterium]|nr:response regulator [Anaerolineae bacterium]